MMKESPLALKTNVYLKEESRRKYEKRLLSLGLVVAMGVSTIAACGSTGSTKDTAGGNEETQAPAQSSAPNEESQESSGGEIELTFPCILVGTDRL